jgi:cyanuric acid amidohydrolase
MECVVHRVPMDHPGDAGAILRLIDSGSVAPEAIAAIFGKTEGNGCVNDFTRAFAVSALSAALAPRLGLAPEAVPAHIKMIMSGGTEGGLSPHFLVFATAPGGHPQAGRKALAIGTATTGTLQPEAIGRLPQVTSVAAAVRMAMQRAQIADPGDVHWVQVKCPLLTRERMAEAARRSARTATSDTYASMGLSRGAAALGVAAALGEIDLAKLDDAAIAHDAALYSTRASSSAGIELMHNDVVVLGNSDAWSGDRVIAHGVMRDAIDLPAVAAVLHELGLAAPGQLDAAAASRIDAVLAKAEASRSGMIRGARHIMWNDSDIQASRHARALVGGVLAGAIGQTALFVSGGAEHQGPTAAARSRSSPAAREPRPIGRRGIRSPAAGGRLARPLLGIGQCGNRKRPLGRGMALASDVLLVTVSQVFGRTAAADAIDADIPGGSYVACRGRRAAARRRRCG